MPSRRKFLAGLVGVAAAPRLLPELAIDRAAALQRGQNSIDRSALVNRHNPIISKIDPLSPFSVGNGEFVFTADVTGLQTLQSEYENAMPLCTMSQWGWHTQPRPRELENATLRLELYDTYGRQVGYHTSSKGQVELFNWLRENPHRLHLGRISFCRTAAPLTEIRGDEISEIEQELDLWRGVISSKFRIDGEVVIVKTAVHSERDLLSVSIASRLLETGRLCVRISFPYGAPAMQAADWKQPARHTTRVDEKRNGARVVRTLDQDRYFVDLSWTTSCDLNVKETHTLLLKPRGRSQKLDFSVLFSKHAQAGSLSTPTATLAAAANHWRRFWTTGGAVELHGSRDSRANELERRVVLSQYLTAIQCSGSAPPQETGLTVNSWYGKFHLEMHWWHAAHFPLWQRLPLLERSLNWYSKILPAARELARAQGYSGARWPKMVGPEGRDSPSPIGPLLIWQQPHPIFYAELCYHSKPTRQTLQRYSEIVFESAEFMSSFPHFDAAKDRFVLGPPVIPAQENHPPRETWNPTFELAYWSYALRIAQSWRKRLGQTPVARWDDIVAKLSKLPVRDGVYLAHENCPETFTERNHDHPSMLGALGVLPGDGVDRETMRRTLKKAMKEWKWDQTWGWDYPMTAMTAARLNEPEIAIDALLMETEKNRYLPNGHNWQRPNLPCYLPGNGGLLYAIALMAGGWKGANSTQAPGFPEKDWQVRSEGLNARLLSQL
jgi:hypothetical protein